MKNQMALNIPLAIVLLAAVATVALRAAARRAEPRPVRDTEPAPVTAPLGAQDRVGDEMARPPDPSGWPASAVEQMQDVFHELHADGRNALCAVCECQYGLA
jgi:hypothetical protein